MKDRIIHAAFWGHPRMCRASDAARLMALGLLAHADDSGYFLADAVLVRGKLRPADEDLALTRHALGELEHMGYIELRTHATHGELGHVPSFAKYQPKTDKASPLAKYWQESPPRPKPEMRAEPVERDLFSQETRPAPVKQKGKSAPAKFDAAAFLTRLPHDCARLRAAWAGFVEVRKLKDKPLDTEYAANLVLNKIERMTHAQAVFALELATVKRWESIYPPKDTDAAEVAAIEREIAGAAKRGAPAGASKTLPTLYVQHPPLCADKSTPWGADHPEWYDYIPTDPNHPNYINPALWPSAR